MKPSAATSAEETADKQGAVARLFQEERTRLLRLATALLGDRALAEDAVQDAYAALYQRWDRLSDQAGAAGYLRVSVINNARSHHRRRALLARLALPLSGGSVPGADETTTLGSENQAVIEAVRRLPRRRQQIVILRYWLDMSERQIAGLLGISEGSVKSGASRALATLRRDLEGGR